jgi:hypothetical protein
VLKSQFAGIDSVSTALECLHSESAKLTVQVRCIRIEKDDALQRLTISLRDVRALTEQLAEQKANAARQFEAGQANLEQSLNLGRMNAIAQSQRSRKNSRG